MPRKRRIRAARPRAVLAARRRFRPSRANRIGAPSRSCRSPAWPRSGPESGPRRALRRTTAPPEQAASRQVARERLPHFARHLHAAAVVRMINADRQIRAPLQRAAHRLVELEAHEMHRGGLLLVLA